MSGRKRTARPYKDLYGEQWLREAPGASSKKTTAQRTAQLLARVVRNSSKHRAIDAGDLQRIAHGFFSVLMGARWESQFPLPDREDPLTPNGERNADVEFLVWKLHNVDDVPVTQAIEQAATEHGVSAGTAREIYYGSVGFKLSKKMSHSSGKTSREKHTK